MKRLVDEYGVSRINADWAVSIWCVCYGKQVLHKPCDIEISKAKTGAAPAIKDEQGTGGKQYNDLFRYKAVSDGYAISGFNGSNTRTLIFPNAYSGKPVTRVLAHAFEKCDVQEAVMTDGIKVIEEGAFSLSKEESSQLANRQYKFIQNLEAALVRIENKTYGISRVTGKLIPKARLLLVPHATTNVEDKQNR